MKKTSLIVPLSFFIFVTIFVFSNSIAIAADQQLKLQVPAPSIGTDLTLCSGSGGDITCNGIAAYITAVYEWLIRIAIVLGVLTLTIAGYFWMTARGDKKQTEKAVAMVKNTLWGIVLALGSYALLWAINPNLVQFKVLNLGKEIRHEELEIDLPDPGPMLPTPTLSTPPGSPITTPPAALSHSGPATNADVRAYNSPFISRKSGTSGQLYKVTAAAFENAASICGQKHNLTIPVTDDWRSVQDQEQLYAKYQAGTGNPACNPHKTPGVVSCPHTSGMALDLTVKTVSDTVYRKISECMKEAGFCRLTGGYPCEPWHFEFPKRSPACNPSFDPGYRVTSRSGCGTPH